MALQNCATEWHCGMALQNCTTEWHCGMALQNCTTEWPCIYDGSTRSPLPHFVPTLVSCYGLLVDKMPSCQLSLVVSIDIVDLLFLDVRTADRWLHQDQQVQTVSRLPTSGKINQIKGKKLFLLHYVEQTQLKKISFSCCQFTVFA